MNVILHVLRLACQSKTPHSIPHAAHVRFGPGDDSHYRQSCVISAGSLTLLAIVHSRRISRGKDIELSPAVPPWHMTSVPLP